MKLKLFSLLFFILLIKSFVSFSSSRPERDSIISISGQVIDSKNLGPVPLASITILRSRKGTICDSVGVFHLQVLQSDTLVISALGFRKKAWLIPTIINPDSPPFFQIQLDDISYLLDEVDIYALGTWDEFREDFINTKLEEKNPINKDIIKQLAPFNTRKPDPVPAQYKPKNEKMSVVDAIFRPTDFLHHKLSKSEKAKKKLAKRIRNESNLKKIASKYNAEIVSSATGLKGDELLDFMEYCGSGINVKSNTTEYEVMRQILFWFEKYKQEPTTKE